MRRLAFLVAIAAVACGCGHSAQKNAQPTVTVTKTATAPPTTSLGTSTPQLLVRIYFLRNGKVAPVGRSVSPPALASQALAELDAGPSGSEREAGFTSDVHAKYSVTIANGIATIDASDATHAGLGQLVYTLTQFASVHGVRTKRMIGDAQPLTRASFEDVTPQILIESPLPGEHATSPLRVTGTANTFEATFDIELRDASGKRLARRFVTATSGSGQRGTFDTTLSFSGTPALLVAWEPSAENGQPLHEVRIPVH